MMMDDDECPDSTVLLDEDDIVDDGDLDVPFPLHRRSFDEPQSSRISSTAALHYGTPSFPTPHQLPPLPKLIFRPSAHAGHYPSVSFSPQQSSLPARLGGVSASTSRNEAQVSSRLSAFPSSRSESFPGTRVNMGVNHSVSREPVSRPEQALPRLEAMSRSELTISRVSSTPTAKSSASKSRLGVTSTTTRNEFPRGVSGMSISRVGSASTSFSKVGPPSPRKITIPQLAPIRAGSPDITTIPTTRQFGRRFLKSSPKPQFSNVRAPMSVMRASSTEDYFSHREPLSLDDMDAAENTMDYTGAGSSTGKSRKLPYSTATSSMGMAPRKGGRAETLTSQQGLTGIKLHIKKPPGPEVIEVDDSDSERSLNSLSGSPVKPSSDSSFGTSYDFSMAPGISGGSSGLNMDEVSVKPIKFKGPFQEKLKIPKDLIIDEADVDEMSLADMELEAMSQIAAQPTPQFLKQIMAGTQNKKKPSDVTDDDSTRRSRRKRQPIARSPDVAPKVRRRRGGANNVNSLGGSANAVDMIIAAVSESGGGGVSLTPTPTPPSGRGRGTGRGRGRPRGSTNKARLLREQERLAQATPTQLEIDTLELDAKPEVEELSSPKMADSADSKEPEARAEQEEKVEVKKEHDENESPVAADTTCAEVENETTPVSVEGDPEVNSEVSSASTPTKRTRGGRGRGGSPRGSGTPSRRGGKRTPRGEKKTPAAKKLKLEKKEAIKAPPPVQVFEEETRMSADIKPPAPDRVVALSTPVVVDEESRASNVSSTSTSTTAKAKRFTKDPIEERKPVTAETLYEYQWPLNDKNAEFYFLQEQISEYLGVKSFKRKYPDIRRRVVDMEERDFLRDSKVVSETQCDLGLTAVLSVDVLDIMFNDFTEKYDEYRKVFQDRKEQEMAKLKPTQISEAETPAVRDRSAEFMRRILKSCAKWNYNNNRDRTEERSCAFDLQTGTMHFQKDKIKVLPSECTKLGKYPVAVLPGQFTDDYKEYTSNELSYLPLNSVRYGPISENWIVDSDSSNESSESEDSNSSSDDSSSSSSDDEDSSVADNDQNYTTLTDEAGNVLYRGITGLTKVSTEANCKSCEGTAFKNKDGNPEVLLHCSRCDVPNHPTCLELTVDMLPFITKYHWECTDCKNCIECNDPADEDKMLFCDCCDRGYHIYCVGLRKVPTGRWHCSVCSLCYSCGATQPSPDDRMAEWHHEFRKGEKGAKFYLHSFCVACFKLFKKGQFCPSCLKVHQKLDKESKGLLECRKCEKWVHRACVKRPLKSMFGFMCDPCDANFRSRSKLPSHVN